MEKGGAIVGLLGSQWVDPNGVVTEVVYASNKATKATKQRTWDAAGRAHDVELSRQTIVSATDTLSANSAGAAVGLGATAHLTAQNPKLSMHPPKAYFDMLTAADQENQAANEKARASKSSADLLEQLGIVGRADAGTISQSMFNSKTTYYGGSMNYGDLSVSWSVYWYNPSGQSGYHSAKLRQTGNWIGCTNLCQQADRGDRDAMDVEWDPGLMYQVGVAWAPDIAPDVCPSDYAKPSYMDATMGRAWSGAYSQKPSHCSKTNILQVDIRPKSSGSYNKYFNVYFNFTHTWNVNPFGGPISISAGFGFLSVGVGLGGGEWNKNIGAYLYC